MLRGAILGVGNVAVHGHLPGWLARRDVTITAAADPRPEGREALHERLPGLRWYDAADELLAREQLDFADICAPPARHARLIGEALEKGLHVLCEKPLVLAPAELPPLREMAREKDRVLATVHNWRHAPVLAFAARLVREGALGDVRFCRWETVREKPAATAGDTAASNWRVDPAVSGGGILMDHGWHALYVVGGWLPQTPERVSGRLSTRRHREWPIEDTAEVFLESGSGVRAEIFLTWAADERRNRVRIEGTRGTIRIEGNILELITTGSPDTGVRREFPGSLSEGSHHPDWFAAVAEEFLSEIGGGIARGRSLEEAADCLELIALARESSLRDGETLAAARATRHAQAERGLMIEGRAEDVLWIASPPGGAPSGTMILGLPLLRREVLAAERAGFGRILVEETAAGGVRSLVEETRGQVLGPMDSVPDLGSGRLVVLSGSVIPQVRWLRDLRQRTLEPRRLALDQGCAAVLETDDLRDAVSILRRRGARDPFDALSALFPAAAPVAPTGERFELTGARDLGRAEDWLLESLIKDTEGFMSRHVERRISLALSRRLASTPVTPNAMTLVSVAVGLLGAALFLRPTAGAPIAGALLVLAHSILDGCDGELARLKFQESRFGGILDFWGDNIVHCALFGAIAVSWSRAAGAGWPLLLGAAAILGTLFSAAFVYRHTMAQVREGPLFTSVSREPGSLFSRMADALARRDFLYLLVLLAALGKFHWFLALAAAGSPIYFLLLLAIAGAGRRRHAAQSAAARAGAVSQ